MSESLIRGDCPVELPDDLPNPISKKPAGAAGNGHTACGSQSAEASTRTEVASSAKRSSVDGQFFSAGFPSSGLE
jgi:hypothetical protein